MIELFDYSPQKITSNCNQLKLNEDEIAKNSGHSIANITIDDKDYIVAHNYTAVHDPHKVTYLDDKFGNIKTDEIDINLKFKFCFIIGKRKLICYNDNEIYLYDVGKIKTLFKDTGRIYFRVDDNQDIIIVYDIHQAGDERGKMKCTKLKKVDDYKTGDTRDYSLNKDAKCNYDNLPFVIGLDDAIVNYYFDKIYYIVVSKFYDNAYEFGVYNYGYTHVHRWTVDENKWCLSEIKEFGENEHYKLNMHLNRRCIAHYYSLHFSFGSAVSEKYSDWKKRMVGLLGDFILRFSGDLLKMIVDYVAS
jgi:hypothetical protein